MSAPVVTGCSRFHTIVAGPLPGSTALPVPPQLPQPGPYEPWGVRFHNGKRRRDSNSDAGPSSTKKAPKRITEDESASNREPTTMYPDRDTLMLALRDRFREGPNVDFNGTYEILNTDTNTHKERIQMVANDIWKTTGYRFTVKDHPQFTNGYKTRFWCSQDDAHRSKSSRAARKAQGNAYKPRVTSAGEVMAKARYACRSRLLISSRDTNPPKSRTCVVTVRLHHHYAHEPYVDTTQPPEVVQRILESFQWLGKDTTPYSEMGRGTDDHATDLMDEDQDSSDGVGDGDGGSFGDRCDTMEGDVRVDDPEQPPSRDRADSSSPVPEYHARMKAHIKNLREFCDGLEYQLQFNDYRMLNVLEQEGGSFLGFVAECLRKEGRLSTADDLNSCPPQPPPEPAHIMHQHQNHSPPHSQFGIDPARTYQANPGINPRALNY